MKKYAAYFADSSCPLIISAQNKREADKKAREYRRAWDLPSLVRLDSITDELAEKFMDENDVKERLENVQESKKEKPSYAPVEILFIEHKGKTLQRAAIFDDKEKCFEYIQCLIDSMTDKGFDEGITIRNTVTGQFYSAQKIRTRYGFRKRTFDEKMSNVKTWTDEPTEVPEAAAPEAQTERPEIISKPEEEKKEEATMETTTTKEFTFTADTMTAKGKTYPVEYSTACNAVIVFVTVNGNRNAAKVRFEKNHPCYADAIAAAEAAAIAWKARRNAGKAAEIPAEPVETVAEKPAEIPAEPVEVITEEPAEIPAQAEEERPEIITAPVPAEVVADDPAARADHETLAAGKAPRGPVPEKTFIGQAITGKGWKILFDGSTSRTRIIFTEKPSDEIKTILGAAGFYYSAGMDSWNKKLTFKAYRAAQAVSEKLAALCA